MVGMLGFEPSQEQSSTAKGIIRPSRVPTPTPKFRLTIILFIPYKRVKLYNKARDGINKSTIPEPVIITIRHIRLHKWRSLMDSNHRPTA